MTKYDSYKPSGIEWIGDVPEHWELIKTNLITENLDGKRIPLNSEERGNRSGDYPYWGSNGIVDYIDDYLFDEELVLIGEDGSPFFEKFKSVSFYVTGKIWVNNHIHILRPKEKILPKFLTYSFNCVDYKGFITGSTRDKLTQSDLNKIYHCVPPTFEQSHIIKFLDEKTEIIDKLISTKERKIELLKEQRTSLINQVITKGLDPNVKMKDSGVEWIGEIPEQWVVSTLKHFCVVKDGTHDTPQYLDDSDDTFPLVTSISFDDGKIDFSKCKKISYEDYSEINKRSDVQKNDIIMSMIGGNIGNRVLVNTDIPFSIKNVCLFKTSTSNKILPNYLLNLIDSKFLKYQIDFNQKGGGQPFLSLDELRNLLFPFPPFSEQQQIVEYLDNHLKEIDDLVSIEHKKIYLLKEYRQSLISEVITGKIDVSPYVN